MDTEKNLLFLKQTTDTTRKSLQELISQIKPILRKAEEDLQKLYQVSSVIDDLLVQINPLQTRLENFDFDVRPYNLLKGAGINTIGDLLSKNDEELAGIDGIGKVALKGIKKVIVDWQEQQPKKISKTPGAETSSFSFEDRVNPVGVL